MKVYLRNFVDGVWELVGSSTLSPNDSTFTFETSTNASRFVNPSTGSIRVKTDYKPTGPIFFYPWIIRHDYVHFTVDPS